MKAGTIAGISLAVAVAAGVFSPQAAAGDQVQQLFSITAGQQSDLSPFVFSPEGDRIIFSHDDSGKVESRDAWSGKSLEQYAAYAGIDESFLFSVWDISPDGKLLALGLTWGEVGFLDLASGDIVRTIDATADGSGNHMSSAAFGPRGDIFATGTLLAKTLKLWDVASGAALSSFGGGIYDLAFHPDGELLVFAGSLDGVYGIHVWNIDESRIIITLAASDPLALSSDGTVLATRSPEGAGDILIWDTKTWKRKLTLAGHSGSLRDVALNPDGKLAVSSATDETVMLWDLKSGRMLESFAAFPAAIEHVRFSPDGTRFGAGNRHGIWVWGTLDAVKFPTKVVRVEASSTLPPDQPGVSYAAEQVLDGNRQTAWNEGVEGHGVGESLTIELAEQVTVDAIHVRPGFFDSRWWQNNGRPKLLNVRTESLAFSLPCKNEMKVQRFAFKNPLEFKQITFEIADVYPGIKYEDTCISEISFYYKGAEIKLELRK